MLKHFKLVYELERKYNDNFEQLQNEEDYTDFDRDCEVEAYTAFRISVDLYNKLHLIKYETVRKWYRKHRARKFDRLCRRFNNITKVLEEF